MNMHDKYINQTIYDTEGKSYALSRLAGFGGQGRVYEEESGEYMVKILHPKNKHNEELMRRFSWIKSQKIPKEARLVTPIAILDGHVNGYVMKRVKGHEPLSKYINFKESESLADFYNKQTGGLKKRLLLGVLMARSFSNIHLSGLSYCDVSPQNILIGKKAVSLCLIDPDNLSVTTQAESLVLGTPRYIAPEVLDERHNPNALSDIYSYAVILFELIHLGHPLLGDMVNDASPEEEDRALSGHYPYINHPTDTTNRNTKILPSDVMLTQKLKDLFEKTFVEGLHQRYKRPSLKDFENALIEAIQQCITCKSCKAHYYLQPSKKNECPWCGESAEKVPFIEFFQFVSKPEDLDLKTSKKLNHFIVLENQKTVLYTNHYTYAVPNEKIGILEKKNESYYFTKYWNKPTWLRMKGTNKVKRIETNQEIEVDENGLLIFQNYTVQDKDFEGSTLLHFAKITRGDND
jgi:DNA-binding helix-hairpin-helix protein with protein kinase domain